MLTFSQWTSRAAPCTISGLAASLLLSCDALLHTGDVGRNVELALAASVVHVPNLAKDVPLLPALQSIGTETQSVCNTTPKTQSTAALRPCGVV